jgi:hypothetical protein
MSKADELRALAREASLKMSFWTRIALHNSEDNAVRRASQWATIVSALLARAAMEDGR